MESRPTAAKTNQRYCFPLRLSFLYKTFLHERERADMETCAHLLLFAIFIAWQGKKFTSIGNSPNLDMFVHLRVSISIASLTNLYMFVRLKKSISIANYTNLYLIVRVKVSISIAKFTKPLLNLC